MNELTEPMIIQTGSRLHFGLISPGEFRGRRFGGAGLMIDSPRNVIQLERAERLRIVADKANTTWLRQLVRQWLNGIRQWPTVSGELPASVDAIPWQIRVVESAGRHMGLGSGTQMALAIATALFDVFQMPEPPIERIAVLMDRGHRSAIGSHGFRAGGFLVDRGKGPGEDVAPLDLRWDFPSQWPVLLVLPRSQFGVHGDRERAAFSGVQPSSGIWSERMVKVLVEGLVPGIAREDYDVFAAALHEFNYASGMQFAAAQGGAWNGSRLEQTVAAFQQAGIPAVGQSSWGPCIFGIARDDEHANRAATLLHGGLQQIWGVGGFRIVTTSGKPQGAERISAMAQARDRVMDPLAGEKQI